MSYSIRALSVNSKMVIALWGCKEELLLEQLKEEFGAKIAELDKWFESDNVDSFLILRDIIYGEISFPELNYVYGYVYEWLCEKHGVDVENHIEIGEFGIGLEYLSEVDSGASAFIPVPVESINDFPHVLSIKKADLLEKRNEFLSTVIDYYTEQEMLDCRNDFEKIFEYAIKSDNDLVFFNY